MSSTNPQNKPVPARVADYFAVIGASQETLTKTLTSYSIFASNAGLEHSFSAVRDPECPNNGGRRSHRNSSSSAAGELPIDLNRLPSVLPEPTGRIRSRRQSAVSSSATSAAVVNMPPAPIPAISPTAANTSIAAATNPSVQFTRSTSMRRQPLAAATYTPTVISRFPAVDHKDTEFPRDLPLFAFPTGYSVAERPQRPESASFVLTEADGTRVYGVYIRFHHDLRDIVDQITASHALNNPPDTPLPFDPIACRSMPSVWVPYVICVTSHWPFYTQFSLLLRQLFHKVVMTSSQARLNPEQVKFLTSSSSVEAPSDRLPPAFARWSLPLERYFANIIYETPLPPAGRLVVESRLLPTVLSFRRPPPNRLPLRDFSLTQLFRWLSIDNVMRLFSAVTVERKIMFVSQYEDRLTIAAESICALIFPFFWRHVYIPLMPAALTDFVCAPMPYIVGVLNSYVPEELMLDQVVVINLDDNTITPINTSIPPLPEARFGSLQRGLKKAVSTDTASPLWSPSSVVNDFGVEVAFLKFFVRLLGSYRTYLEAPAEYVLEKLDRERFLADHPDSGVYLSEVTETQMFQCFVDDRYEASSGGRRTARQPDTTQAQAQQHLDVLFFDEMIDKSQGKPTPFLTDTSQDHSSTVFALDIAPDGVPTDWMHNTGAYTGPDAPHLLAIAASAAANAGDDPSAGDAAAAAAIAAVCGDGSASSPTPAPYGLGWPLLGHNAWFEGEPLENVCTVGPDGEILSPEPHHPRRAPLLVDASEAAGAGGPRMPMQHVPGGSAAVAEGQDLGQMNLKFFSDKRLYTQHFHTLRLKSSKQDTLFKDIVAMLTSQQSFDEDIVAGLERICVSASRGPAANLVTATTMDKPWRMMLANADSQAARETTLLQQTRQDVFVPLATDAVEAEQRLRLLFSEAARLETQAGNAKTIAEKAKKKHEFTKKIYAELVTKRSASASDSIFNSFSSADLHRVLDAHSAMEDAGLALDQAEIMYQMVLKEYDARMPRIIEEIRELNSSRIHGFKQRMQVLVRLRREALEEQLRSLDAFSADIDSIDVKRDIKTFSEGMQDFWLSSGGGPVSTAAIVASAAQPAPGRVDTQPQTPEPHGSPVPEQSPLGTGTAASLVGGHGGADSVSVAGTASVGAAAQDVVSPSAPQSNANLATGSLAAGSLAGATGRNVVLGDDYPITLAVVTPSEAPTHATNATVPASNYTGVGGAGSSSAGGPALPGFISAVLNFPVVAGMRVATGTPAPLATPSQTNTGLGAAGGLYGGFGEASTTRSNRIPPYHRMSLQVPPNSQITRTGPGVIPLSYVPPDGSVTAESRVPIGGTVPAAVLAAAVAAGPPPVQRRHSLTTGVPTTPKLVAAQATVAPHSSNAALTLNTAAAAAAQSRLVQASGAPQLSPSAVSQRRASLSIASSVSSSAMAAPRAPAALVGGPASGAGGVVAGGGLPPRTRTSRTRRDSDSSSAAGSISPILAARTEVAATEAGDAISPVLRRFNLRSPVSATAAETTAARTSAAAAAGAVCVGGRMVRYRARRLSAVAPHRRHSSADSAAINAALAAAKAAADARDGIIPEDDDGLHLSASAIAAAAAAAAAKASMSPAADAALAKTLARALAPSDADDEDGDEAGTGANLTPVQDSSAAVAISVSRLGTISVVVLILPSPTPIPRPEALLFTPHGPASAPAPGVLLPSPAPRSLLAGAGDGLDGDAGSEASSPGLAPLSALTSRGAGILISTTLDAPVPAPPLPQFEQSMVSTSVPPPPPADHTERDEDDEDEVAQPVPDGSQSARFCTAPVTHIPIASAAPGSASSHHRSLSIAGGGAHSSLGVPLSSARPPMAPRPINAPRSSSHAGPAAAATAIAAAEAFELAKTVGSPALTSCPTPGLGAASMAVQRAARVLRICPRIRFPLSLWGDIGYDYAASVCQASKDCSKEIMSVLDSWAQLEDQRAKRLASAAKMTPPPPSCFGATQQKLWERVRESVRAAAFGTNDLACFLFKLAFAMRIVKGELKQAKRRYQDHKARLERDLQAAHEVVLRAAEKRARARTQWQQVAQRGGGAAGHAALSARDFESTSRTLDRVGGEFKEAEHALTLAERDKDAMQRKHDICVGRLLALLERKEKRVSMEMQVACWTVCDWVESRVVDVSRFIEEDLLATAVAGLDVDADTRDLIRRIAPEPGDTATEVSVSKSVVSKAASVPQRAYPTGSTASAGVAAAPTPVPTSAAPPVSAAAIAAAAAAANAMAVVSVTDGDGLTVPTRLDDPGAVTVVMPPPTLESEFCSRLAPHVDAVLANCSTVADYLKHIVTLVDEIAATEETALRSMRRITLPILERTGHPTLRSCFAALGTLIESLIQRTDADARSLRDASKAIAALRVRIRDATKSREKRFTDHRKANDVALTERDRARRDHEATAETLLANNAKLASLEKDEESKKGGFFTKSPYDLAKSKVESAQRELEKAQRTLVRKEEALLSAAEALRTETEAILRACFADERTRVAHLAEALRVTLASRRVPLATVVTRLTMLDSAATKVNISYDLEYILQRTGGLKVPGVVRADVAAVVAEEPAEMVAMMATSAAVAADRAAEEQVKLHYLTAARMPHAWTGAGNVSSQPLSLAAMAGRITSAGSNSGTGGFSSGGYYSSGAGGHYGGTYGSTMSTIDSTATYIRPSGSLPPTPVGGGERSISDARGSGGTMGSGIRGSSDAGALAKRGSAMARFNAPPQHHQPSTMTPPRSPPSSVGTVQASVSAFTSPMPIGGDRAAEAGPSPSTGQTSE